MARSEVGGGGPATTGGLWLLMIFVFGGSAAVFTDFGESVVDTESAILVGAVEIGVSTLMRLTTDRSESF